MEPILWLKVFLAQWQGQKPGGPPQHSLVGMLISLWAPGPQRPLSAGKALFLAHRTQGIPGLSGWPRCPTAWFCPHWSYSLQKAPSRPQTPQSCVAKPHGGAEEHAPWGLACPGVGGGWLCLWLNLTLKACS